MASTDPSLARGGIEAHPIEFTGSGGEYFRGRNGEEVQRISDSLDRLEPVEQKPTQARPAIALCRWPLLTMLTLYGALDLFFAAKSALEAPRGKLLTFICLPFLFPVVHIVYGAGTLCGLLAGKAQPHA